MTTPSDRRIALGLVVQPVIAFGVGVIIGLVGMQNPASRVGNPTARTIAAGVEVAAVVVVACSVALPIIVWLRGRGQLTYGRVLCGGFVIGNIPTGIAAVSVLISQTTSVPFAYAIAGPLTMGSFCGLVGAGLFWFIACRQPAPHPATPVT